MQDNVDLPPFFPASVLCSIKTIAVKRFDFKITKGQNNGFTFSTFKFIRST